VIMRDLTNLVSIGEDLGPSAAEARSTGAVTRGVPGAITDALSTPRRGRGASCVRETAPAYVTLPHADCELQVAADRSAGVGRLERTANAARSLASRGRHARAARVLRRCAEGLAARGARAASASAWCALGELHLVRGRPDEAVDMFARARRACPDGSSAARMLVGSG